MADDALIADLLATGVITSQDLVEDRVAIHEYAGRTGGTAVHRSGARSWFLKRRGPDEAGAAIAHEARILEHLSGRPDVAPFTPRIGWFDAERRTLALALLPGQNLREMAASDSGIPASLAADIGAALGTLHRSERGCDPAALGGPEIAWVLSLHRPRPSDLTWLSLASLELVRRLQAEMDVCRLIDEVRQGWRPETLVHGDVRWDNVVTPSQLDGPARGVWLVDWESAGVGDPAWDVGSVFGQVISDWVLSARQPSPGSSRNGINRAGLALQRSQARARAFWTAYLDRAVLAGADELLARATRYAGVRLLQFGIEIAQSCSAPNWSALAHLQVGANVLRRPDRAASAVIGLVTVAR